MICSVCKEDWDTPYYEDTTCPMCGQVYVFDEGVVIQLTKEQYEVLRQHWEETKQ